MALEIVTSTAAAATTVAPKQIQAVSSSSNAVLYAVPSGREFTGIVGGSSYQYFVTINDVGNNNWATSSSTFPVQMTFVAGTVIKGSSNAGSFIFGVERDAT